MKVTQWHVVAVALILGISQGISPIGFSENPPTDNTQQNPPRHENRPSEDTTQQRRFTDADMLNLVRLRRVEAFEAVLVKQDGTKSDIHIKDSKLEALKALATKSEKLRETLEACGRRNDDSSKIFAELVDGYVGLLSDWIFDQDGHPKPKAQIEFKVKALKVYTFLFLKHYAKKKQVFGREDAWDKGYIETLKTFFKEISGEDYKDDGIAQSIDQLSDENPLDRKLKVAVDIEKDASEKLKRETGACNVVVTPTTSPSPSPGTSPTPTPGLSPGAGAPGTATPTPTPGAGAGAGAGQGAGAGAGTGAPADGGLPGGAINNDALAGIGQQFNDQLAREADRLKALEDALLRAQLDADRARRDLEALLANDDNNADAIAELARALGQNNNEQPQIPPQLPPITPPQAQSTPENAIPTPPPSEEEEPGPQQPPYGMLPPPGGNNPPPVFVVGDQNRNALFDDLRPRAAVPVPNPTADALKEITAMNRELLLNARQNQLTMNGGMNANSIAYRLMGMGGMRMPMAPRGPAVPGGRFPLAAATRSGTVGATGVNPAARGPIPRALQ